MSNAGPGLSPNKQAASGKVAAVDERGNPVKAGYQNGNNRKFQTAQPKAPPLPPGTGGARSVGGRGREAQNVGKYTPPKWD
jgi:hypothetical protein